MAKLKQQGDEVIAAAPNSSVDTISGKELAEARAPMSSWMSPIRPRSKIGQQWNSFRLRGTLRFGIPCTAGSPMGLDARSKNKMPGTHVRLIYSSLHEQFLLTNPCLAQVLRRFAIDPRTAFSTAIVINLLNIY